MQESVIMKKEKVAAERWKTGTRRTKKQIPWDVKPKDRESKDRMPEVGMPNDVRYNERIQETWMRKLELKAGEPERWGIKW